jgi:hypothetical protein
VEKIIVGNESIFNKRATEARSDSGHMPVMELIVVGDGSITFGNRAVEVQSNYGHKSVVG